MSQRTINAQIKEEYSSQKLDARYATEWEFVHYLWYDIVEKYNVFTVIIQGWCWLPTFVLLVYISLQIRYQYGRWAHKASNFSDCMFVICEPCCGVTFTLACATFRSSWYDLSLGISWTKMTLRCHTGSEKSIPVFVNQSWTIVLSDTRENWALRCEYLTCQHKHRIDLIICIDRSI